MSTGAFAARRLDSALIEVTAGTGALTTRPTGPGAAGDMPSLREEAEAQQASRSDRPAASRRPRCRRAPSIFADAPRYIAMANGRRERNDAKSRDNKPRRR